MFDFINKSISRKIIFWMFVLMTLSSFAVLFSTVTKVRNDNIKTTKENLAMLNTAIFQSLRNSMNTGDPEQIQAAERKARDIKGVQSLIVAKSKPLIELYSPGSAFTTDNQILKAFDTKQNRIVEIDDDKGHSLRMIKPMIATKECLMCHVNQQEGDVIGVMDLTFSLEESDNSLQSIIINIVVTSTILGWITIGIIFYVVRGATKPIDGLKEGFRNLIDANDFNMDLKLDVKSKDEIGEVARLFNDYMDKIHADLRRDEIVINETNDVLQKIANGFFVYEVTSTASNPHVEAMKKNLNFMIKKVKTTIDKINVALRHYSESRYDYKIDDRGIYGDLGAVTAGIKLVGNNTSEILSMILNTGEHLDRSTQTLSESSAGLSASANTQAASLEETAAALEEMTSTIKGNTQNTVKMSELATGVRDSALSGKRLAQSTLDAMDEIVSQITSINEAIEVIDQIAFQTNILSLNAAVEAATAGEAGKGFAVVAQEVRNLASRSAEAAKEIKELVENATLKANHGKEVADDMIGGYEDLNNNIYETTQLIDDVASSSNEQFNAIVQINDAVNQLDQTTQRNSSVSGDISNMSYDIKNLSSKLVSAASKASFLEETRTQVCDVDLIYDISHLKVQLFDYKDDVYARLADPTNTRVVRFTPLDTWLDSYSQKESKVDPEVIESIKQMNDRLYQALSKLMEASITKQPNTTINEFARKVEIESMRIFGTLNQIKEYKCKGQN